MKEKIVNIIADFVNLIKIGKIEIYNEFSLQHELGIHLRNNIDSIYKTQFERNVKFFYEKDCDFIKKEMDIVIYDKSFVEKYCIELKFPRNGEYPEQMFSMCKDICFLESLKERGFSECFLFTCVDDINFYQCKKGKANGIYEYFRSGKTFCGEIIKPTGNKDCKINLKKTYQIEWRDITSDIKYFLVSI